MEFSSVRKDEVETRVAILCAGFLQQKKFRVLRRGQNQRSSIAVSEEPDAVSGAMARERVESVWHVQRSLLTPRRISWPTNTSTCTRINQVPACFFLDIFVMSASSKHTPRGKKARSGFAIANVDNGALVQDTETKTLRPAFPLVAFLLPAKSSVSQWVTLPLILMAVGLFRWATGFWSYSGTNYYVYTLDFC